MSNNKQMEELKARIAEHLKLHPQEINNKDLLIDIQEATAPLEPLVEPKVYVLPEEPVVDHTDGSEEELGE
jgi:hypothetical protein